MGKLRKRLIVVFCIGVFLCGIGGGIAFAEFSALSYGGQQALVEPDMRTGNYDVAFQPEDGTCKIVFGNGWGPMNIQTDLSVPADTVRFHATYDADRVEPYALLEQEEGRAVFSWHWTDTQDDVALMLEAKDVVLQNLKEGKIVSFYSPRVVEEVTVWVNPKNVDDVEIVYY